MLSVMYRGSFLSKRGVTWNVEILKEGFAGQVTELTFPADTPLEFNWAETDKLEPVQASSATLKIVSETDRQFVGLYTVAVGDVRMDVYRKNALYWSGNLDTELYEEPYSAANGYDVTLTFSDFACLDRFNWNETGFMSVYDIIADCLRLTGINYSDIIAHISTSTSVYSDPLDLTRVNVLQDDFYDEDGEGMTAREVLEAVLKPFAMRIIQKGGKIYIYDLNALHSENATQVTWDDTDAALSVDVIYNNVKVTFSPYADAKMMEGKVEKDDSLTSETGGSLIRMDYHRNKYGSLDSLEGFRIHINDTLKSNMIKDAAIKFFQVCRIWSGEEANGIIATLRVGDYSVDSGLTRQVLKTPKDCGTIATGVRTSGIITCPKAYLGYTSIHRTEYKLRINLSVLIDTRYNPYEDGGDDNEGGNYGALKNWCNYGYVPIRLTLQSADGNALYHYENYQIVDSGSYSHDGKERWVAGAGEWGQAYLGYYDRGDLKSSSGFGGWKTNKPIIGYYRGDLPESWKIFPDGEYISLPPVGGYLVLEIGEGFHQFDYGREVKDIYSKTRWIAYKEPSITLCSRNYKEVESKDLEDSAWLNRAAKEELSIDTILGTMTKRHGTPNAKGQLFDSSFNIYYEFSRAGVTDRLERLLIGTVYSQYASRHVVLSGTAVLVPDFGVLSDAATPGKFIMLGENQDCIEDTSDIVMAEFSEDNYEGIEYE